jgi:hypothetical protein
MFGTAVYVSVSLALTSQVDNTHTNTANRIIRQTAVSGCIETIWRRAVA